MQISETFQPFQNKVFKFGPWKEENVIEKDRTRKMCLKGKSLIADTLRGHTCHVTVFAMMTMDARIK